MHRTACSVKGCESRNASNRFPNPIRDLQLFNTWVQLTGNELLKSLDPVRVYNNKRVCRNHFRLTDLSTNNRIAKNAILRFNLPDTSVTKHDEASATIQSSGKKYYCSPMEDPIRDYNLSRAVENKQEIIIIEEDEDPLRILEPRVAAEDSQMKQENELMDGVLLLWNQLKRMSDKYEALEKKFLLQKQINGILRKKLMMLRSIHKFPQSFSDGTL